MQISCLPETFSWISCNGSRRSISRYAKVWQKKGRSILKWFGQGFKLTAISKPTGRCSLQFIDVKSSAIPDSNVITPITATARPMITNFPTHYTLSYGRMSPLQPPWSMRTTAIFGRAFSGHPITSCTSKAIPAFGEPTARLITSEWPLTSVSHTTVNVV